MKDSPSKVDQIGVKVRTANDAVQSIKQLRKEIVEIMSQLLSLAKLKNPKGMLPLCNEMITKTRSLLNIWEPSLVEEAFAFIEKHRIIDDSTDSSVHPMKLSPFRNITQQLGALELKSPDLEDFASPTGSMPLPNLWEHARRMTSPCVDIPKIAKNENNNGVLKEMQNFKIYQDNVDSLDNRTTHDHLFEDIKLDNVPPTEFDNLSYSLPPNCGLSNNDDKLVFSETHFDVSGEILTSLPSQIIHTTTPLPKRNVKTIAQSQAKANADERYNSMDLGGILVTQNQLNESKNEILLNSNEFDENGRVRKCSIAFGQNGTFLDTKAMSSSPSANYYRPTEEPEPLDLTQLNIEASVMCLVSKVKFLCGRCGSPAVRLRQPKANTRRGFTNIQNTINNQPYASNPNLNDNDMKTGKTNLTPNVNVNNNAIACGIESAVSKELNLALNQVVDGVTRKVSKVKGNKFTDGLDLSLTTDWASELRPSMRKLRHAMDGLLKTARLMHSVQRLQQDMKKTSNILSTMYRRDVCFSQSVRTFLSNFNDFKSRT